MFDVSQVAEILHVHPNSVRRYITQRKLKGRRIGRKWLFTQADIDRVLKNK